MNQLLEEKYKELGISEKVYAFGEKIEQELKERFEKIDANAEYNQMKVIAAMQKNRVSAECFNISSGYGYNDMGRDTLERVYADCFGGEDALVRPQITCGTHALALALMSNLRPGDELLSPVGKPYDTLEEVIGIRPSKGSLAEYGITYSQVDLLPDGGFDYDGIRAAINEKTRLITIQRSKGYATRPSYSVEEIGRLKAERATVPANDALDPHYRRLRYCRYADDFLIGVTGSKAETSEAKKFSSMPRPSSSGLPWRAQTITSGLSAAITPMA